MVQGIEGKVVLVNAVEACGGSRRVTPLFLNLALVAEECQLHAMATVPPGKDPRPTSQSTKSRHPSSQFCQLWDSASWMNYVATEYSHKNNS